MAKKKRPQQTDEQDKPKGERDRTPRGSGHFVTIHEPDGETHAVYIKGPAPKGMKRGGMPESVRKHLDRKGGEARAAAIKGPQQGFREKLAAAKAAQPKPTPKAEGRGTPERTAKAKALKDARRNLTGDRKPAWLMTAKEHQAERQKLQINSSGTGGESRYGMGRATSERGFAHIAEARSRVQHRLSGGTTVMRMGQRYPGGQKDATRAALLAGEPVPSGRLRREGINPDRPLAAPGRNTPERQDRALQAKIMRHAGTAYGRGNASKTDLKTETPLNRTAYESGLSNARREGEAKAREAKAVVARNPQLIQAKRNARLAEVAQKRVGGITNSEATRLMRAGPAVTQKIRDKYAAKLKEVRAKQVADREKLAAAKPQPPAKAGPSLREQVERHRAGKGTREERVKRLSERIDERLPRQSPLSENRPKQHAPFRAPTIAQNVTRVDTDEYGKSRNAGERVETNRTGKRFWFTRSAQGYMSSYASTTSQKTGNQWANLVRRKARLSRLAGKA